MPLHTHLCRHAFLLGHETHLSRLEDFVCQRLLAVDWLAMVHCGQSGGRMRVVRRRNDHGINRVTQLCNHLSVVTECACVRKLLAGSLQRLRIDVTHCRDLNSSVRRHRSQIGSTHTAHTDMRRAQPTVGRERLHAGRQNVERRKRGTCTQKLATLQTMTHLNLPVDVPELGCPHATIM